MGAATLAPSVERLDEMQYLRLSKLAESHGVDPAQVMPSDELRQAALASGDARSDESIELMDAYRSAFIAIEGPGRPAVGGQ
jgi:hypothetical protein